MRYMRLMSRGLEVKMSSSRIPQPSSCLKMCSQSSKNEVATGGLGLGCGFAVGQAGGTSPLSGPSKNLSWTQKDEVYPENKEM